VCYRGENISKQIELCYVQMDLSAVPSSITPQSQAIGMRYGCPEAAAFLNDFIKESTSSGYIAELFDKYGVTGKLILPSP
jgi:hypothetical protein